MSYGRSRLTLHVDIFDQTAQSAKVLPELTPLRFIANILQEFRELEYLGDDPTAYQLLHAETREPLLENQPLGTQLSDGAALILVEQEFPLPAGTLPLRPSVYLREVRTGTSYRIQWQPAIIGRVSENSAWNDQVAVDLRSYPTGMRVSRRHAKVWEEAGSYFIEVMQNNPVTLRRDGQDIATLVEQSRHALCPDDIIRLDRSDISLKFIVRAQDDESVA